MTRFRVGDCVSVAYSWRSDVSGVVVEMKDNYLLVEWDEGDFRGMAQRWFDVNECTKV